MAQMLTSAAGEAHPEKTVEAASTVSLIRHQDRQSKTHRAATPGHEHDRPVQAASRKSIPVTTTAASVAKVGRVPLRRGDGLPNRKTRRNADPNVLAARAIREANRDVSSIVG